MNTNPTINRRSFLRKSSATTASMLLMAAGATCVSMAHAGEPVVEDAQPGDVFAPTFFASSASDVTWSVKIEWLDANGNVLGTDDESGTAKKGDPKGWKPQSLDPAPAGTTKLRKTISHDP